MGMQKSEDTGLGVTASSAYHRICQVRGDPKDPAGLRVRVASYYDKAARDADNKPYKERVFRVVPDVAATNTNMLADLYAKVKAEASQNAGFFNSGVTDVDPD